MNIRRELERLNQKMETNMTKIDDVLRDERAESDKIDALTKSQADLKVKLQAALASENLSADTQKKIDDAFSQAEANNAKLDAMNTIIDPATGLPETAADAARRLTNDSSQNNDARRLAGNDSGSGGTGVIGDAPPAGTQPMPGSEFQIKPDPMKSPTASLGPDIGGAAENNTAPIATAVEFNPDKPAGAVGAEPAAAPAPAPTGDTAPLVPAADAVATKPV